MIMLKPIHITPEPAVCRTFGCGRRLTYTEQLYGGRCLACSGDKKETIINYKHMPTLSQLNVIPESEAEFNSAVPDKTETIPVWYTKGQMYDWLIQTNYSKQIAGELSEAWANLCQGAFKKGWEKAANDGKFLDHKDYKYCIPGADDIRVRVLADVNAERNRQHSIYGEQNHTPVEWLAILGEEFGEVCKAVCEARYSGGNLDNYREELVQVAAVAVQMIECYDRNKIINP